MLSGRVTTPSGPARFITVVCAVDHGTRIITTRTNSAGRYQFHVPQNDCALIFIEPVAGLSVTPKSHCVGPVCSPISDLDFELNSIIATDFTISGTVTQSLAPVLGIAIHYTVNGQRASTLTDVFGHYSFSVPAGADVFIQPVGNSILTFQPPSLTLADVTMDVAGQDFIISNTNMLLRLP